MPKIRRKYDLLPDPIRRKQTSVSVGQFEEKYHL